MRVAAVVGVLSALASASCVNSPPNGSFSVQLSGSASPNTPPIKHPIVAPHDGPLRVTLTWQNPTVDLDLFLTPASCTDPLSLSCQVISASTAGTPVITETVTGRAVAGASQLTVWVIYFTSSGPVQPYTLKIDVN